MGVPAWGQAQVGAPPATSSALTAWAVEQVRARNYDAALKATGARIAAAPDDGAAVFLRGAILNRLGYSAAAATIFEAYARAGGRHPSLALEWGIALMHSRRFAAAADQFEAYRKTNPKWPQVHILLGQSLLGAGKVAGARDWGPISLGDSALGASPQATATYKQEFLGGVEFEVAQSVALGVRYVHRSLPRAHEAAGPLGLSDYLNETRPPRNFVIVDPDLATLPSRLVPPATRRSAM